MVAGVATAARASPRRAPRHGCASTETSTATASSGSSSPTSPGWTRRRNTTMYGPVRAGAARVPWLIHHTTPARLRRSADRGDGGPVAVRGAHNVMWSLSRQASGEPSPRRADRRCGTRPRPLPRRRRNPRTALSPTGPLSPGDTLRAPGASRPPEAIGRRLVEETLLSDRFWRASTSPALRSTIRLFRPRPLLGPAPLLAGPFVDERRVAGLAGAAPAGLRRRGRRTWRNVGRVVVREGLREYYTAHRRGHGGATGLRLDALGWRCEPDPQRRPRRGGGDRSGFGKS
jgi:hypothetical protein